MLFRKNILVFVIIAFCHGIDGTYYQHQINLLNDLLDTKRYDSRIRPVTIKGTTVPIDADIGIGDYIEIHENTQTMTVDLWLTLYWKDELLSWNSSDYGGLTAVRVDVSQVWYVDVIIHFSSDHDKIINKRAQLIAYSDGTIASLTVTSISFRCFLDVTKFPFDKQTCMFYMNAQNAILSEAAFRNYSMHVNKIGEGQWGIVSYDTMLMVKSNVSMLNVSISVQRRPSYYIIYIIIPIFATAELNPVVFLIPAESGEKVSTAVTILLSYTVFLSIISDVLPKTSTSISAVSLYIAFSQIISGVYVLLCVFIVRRSRNADSCNPCLWFSFGKSNSVSEERNQENKVVNKTPMQYADKLDRMLAVASFSLVSFVSLSVFIYTLV